VRNGCKIRDASPKTRKERIVRDVNSVLSTLRHMFNKDIEWEMMEKSPFEKVKKLFFKENNQRVRYLLEWERGKLPSKCVEYLLNIGIVALNTGMRKGEILSLKWRQIRNGFIYLVKTKTDEARQIPLNNTLSELFQSLPRYINSEYVFCR
jgi:integrase